MGHDHPIFVKMQVLTLVLLKNPHHNHKYNYILYLLLLPNNNIFPAQNKQIVRCTTMFIINVVHLVSLQFMFSSLMVCFLNVEFNFAPQKIGTVKVNFCHIFRHRGVREEGDVDHSILVFIQKEM